MDDFGVTQACGLLPGSSSLAKNPKVKWSGAPRDSVIWDG
jgi:hypothetical protein